MRYTISQLIGLMAFVAIGLGALAGASSIVANIVFTTTILVFCTACVGLCLASGQVRAFCLEFLVFGGVHLILTLAPWSEHRTGEMLLSRRALDVLGQAMGHDSGNFLTMRGVWDGLTGGSLVSDSPPHIYLAFVIIGQCWFSVALGWLGGVTACYFVRRSRDASRQ